MESKIQHHETKILKGRSVLENLCEECLFLGDKVLIVFADNAIKQSGLYARVVSLLNICGIEHVTYECSGLHYTAEEITNAIALGKQENVQLVLAIGDEELMCFTKIVAYGFHGQDLISDGAPTHLPIINVSAILKQNTKRELDFVYPKNNYAHIKPVALFLDYDF
ncbi:MAG TPA: iron-containing alcohol dehydrogenase [Pelobium sp.]|nr:iron-containing alcohol dehydrogenase [Pelobium sp.]